jgi:hypothetical protein
MIDPYTARTYNNYTTLDSENKRTTSGQKNVKSIISLIALENINMKAKTAGMEGNGRDTISNVHMTFRISDEQVRT